MATVNNKNTVIKTIIGKDTWPLSATKTGKMNLTAGSTRVMGITNITYGTIVGAALSAGNPVKFSNGSTAIVVSDDGVNLLKVISINGVIPNGITYTDAGGTNGATVVSSVGTAFLTELKIGDWLVDFTNNELRKIVEIISNDNLTVNYNFSNTVAAASVITTIGSSYVEQSIVFNPTAGLVDGVALPANIGFSWGKQGRTTSGDKDFVDPIIVDATATNAYLSATL